jgi:hypothetical protein
VHHDGLHGLAALNVGIPRQSDQNIAVHRPIDAEPTIVLFKPLQQIRRLVILWLLRDLSPVRVSLQEGPRQVAERLLARGNVAVRSEAVQIERRSARADLLFANDPF